MTSPVAPVVFRFGEFELDLGAYELRRQGRRVKLGKQPMDLLILLVQRPRQLVSRAEIAERLWGPDVFVDIETGVNTAISKVRQALRDTADRPAYVETVAGRGYRFIAPIDIVPVPVQSVNRSATPPRRPPRRAARDPVEPAAVGRTRRGGPPRRPPSASWPPALRSARCGEPGTEGARRPGGRRSPSCPSRTPRTIPSRTTWRSASPTRPAPRSPRSTPAASSSRAGPPATRAPPRRSPRSARSWGSSTSSTGRSAPREGACASPPR